MGEIIFIILILVPAVLGLAECIHFLKRILLFSGKNPKVFAVVVLDDSDFELQLASVYEKLCWAGNRYAQTIVALDDNLSDENKVICRGIFNKKGITVCNGSQLEQMIK